MSEKPPKPKENEAEDKEAAATAAAEKVHTGAIPPPSDAEKAKNAEAREKTKAGLAEDTEAGEVKPENTAKQTPSPEAHGHGEKKKTLLQKIGGLGVSSLKNGTGIILSIFAFIGSKIKWAYEKYVTGGMKVNLDDPGPSGGDHGGGGHH